MACVDWAPNNDWIVSCNNKDYTGRIWDVSFPGNKKSKNPIQLENQMVCVLKKHKYKIIKMIFHTDL